MTKIQVSAEVKSPQEIAEFLQNQGSANDIVNHPAHYNQGKIEVIEFIEDQKLGYHLGNAVKYICRAGRKDPSKVVEDLKKAMWYIQRDIERLTAVSQGRDAVRPNDMPLQTEAKVEDSEEGKYGII